LPNWGLVYSPRQKQADAGDSNLQTGEDMTVGKVEFPSLGGIPFAFFVNLGITTFSTF